jgi:hypothetical protein
MESIAMSMSQLVTQPLKYDVKFLRVRNAIQISRLCRSTILNHIRKGNLKSVKIGGVRLIPEPDFRRFLRIEGIAFETILNAALARCFSFPFNASTSCLALKQPFAPTSERMARAWRNM